MHKARQCKAMPQKSVLNIAAFANPKRTSSIANFVKKSGI
jgi:hypothetical protein